MHSTLTSRYHVPSSLFLLIVAGLLLCTIQDDRPHGPTAVARDLTHTTPTSNPSITIARYFARHSRTL